MTSRITHDAEAAFLALVARRALKAQREAEAEGEVYHPMARPADLQCGVSAALHFEQTPQGYTPVLLLYPRDKGYTEEELAQIAQELLGDHVAQVSGPGDSPERVRYVRKTDVETYTVRSP